jgi:uncharacterized low-complexity protein
MMLVTKYNQEIRKIFIMNAIKKTTLAVALGTVVMTAGFSAQVEANPFGFQQLTSGYQLDGGEGKCGGEKAEEGKCGGDMKASAGKAAEGKCGEGKCGGDMMMSAEKVAEGKCGEGKCGGDMKKSAEKAVEGKCGGDKMKSAETTKEG